MKYLVKGEWKTCSQGWIDPINWFSAFHAFLIWTNQSTQPPLVLQKDQALTRARGSAPRSCLGRACFGAFQDEMFSAFLLLIPPRATMAWEFSPASLRQPTERWWPKVETCGGHKQLLAWCLQTGDRFCTWCHGNYLASASNNYSDLTPGKQIRCLLPELIAQEIVA